MNPPEPLRIRDFLVFRDFLTRETQELLVKDIRAIAEAAPMVQPITPGGRKMSVRMTSGGRLGWVTDRSGYRYQGQHPYGTDWPAIPDRVLSIWKALSGVNRAPDCCLVNFYGERAKMGMHQDKDEGSFDWPVVSVSLGDDALFRTACGNEVGVHKDRVLSTHRFAVMTVIDPVRIRVNGDRQWSTWFQRSGELQRVVTRSRYSRYASVRFAAA